ncbi:MAG: TolC family protein [Acidobacteria bacterium]|nr:TolC family protein [Acidobacteriota bacterium]
MIWWLLAAPCLLAQSALTLEEAVAMALKNHPDAAVARAARNVSAAQISATQALPQPELRVSFNNFAIDPELLEARSNLGIRWSPPRPRELSLKKQIAQTRHTAVEASIHGFEARLAAETRHAFRRATLAAERVRIAEQALALRTRVLDVVKRQVAAGLKEATEADLAELTVADSQTELRRLRNTAAAESRALFRYTGATPAALTPEDNLLQNPAPVSHHFDPQSRAELQQAAASCRESDLLASIAKNQRYPWISFTQVTRRVSAIENRGPWSFQFGIDLPLLRPAAKAEQRIATAQAARCRTQQQALENQIRNEVAEALAALEAARLDLIEVDRIRSGIATKALERSQTALASGRADQVDVLLAEARTVALHDRWLERRLEYARLQAQYEHAISQTNN